ncbi:MAG: ATP-binding cassette domain-containing protein [Lachnospiraceae bacterium]|nr:ATP-binding cassette domain-containing protein [Lachnospiraceae bacterium]
MSETVIKAENLTKDYGKNRGIFQVDLDVKRGETFGFIGTNGSGKTTTIRNMMGFVRPDNGKVSILDKDAWRDATEIKKYVSYIPGEIAFPALPTGTAFLKAQADMLHVKDFTYMNRLLKLLQLDPTANLRRMSKGMKQKTAIVAALMGDREILVMDEPTTGLDPLMRDVFLDLMREEKERGKTIFMSSQIIDEMEEICDKVAVINNGHIIGILDAWSYRHEDVKNFEIELASSGEMQKLCEQWRENLKVNEDGRSCTVAVEKKNTGKLLAVLKNFRIVSLHEKHKALADAFKELYRSE